MMSILGTVQCAGARDLRDPSEVRRGVHPSDPDTVFRWAFSECERSASPVRAHMRERVRVRARARARGAQACVCRLF